jgi:YfiH family protein
MDDEKKIYGDQGLPNIDAIVTNLKNVAIAIVTADCSPILFYDEKYNIIGAAHAGWKGAKSGVIKNTVEAMRNLGAKNIKVKIGPMIQQESYQVSQEFYDEFVNEDSDNKRFFIDGKEEGKYMFDLASYVEKKIKEEGIKEIDNPRTDTYKDEEKFFSFRRSIHKGESDCGRNISLVMIAN